MLHIISTMLHLLQLTEMFGSFSHEDTHEHMKIFIRVCRLLSFKKISQELVRLRFFPLSLMGEAHKWIDEFPCESL